MIYDHILITDSTSEPTNELEFFTEELSVYHIPVNESPQQPPKKKVKHVPQILNMYSCAKKSEFAFGVLFSNKKSKFSSSF